jgi:hypothetical protein
MPRGMRWIGHAEHMEKMRNAYKIPFRKPKGKSQGKKSCFFY